MRKEFLSLRQLLNKYLFVQNAIVAVRIFYVGVVCATIADISLVVHKHVDESCVLNRYGSWLLNLSLLVVTLGVGMCTILLTSFLYNCYIIWFKKKDR